MKSPLIQCIKSFVTIDSRTRRFWKNHILQLIAQDRQPPCIIRARSIEGHRNTRFPSEAAQLIDREPPPALRGRIFLGASECCESLEFRNPEWTLSMAGCQPDG